MHSVTKESLESPSSLCKAQYIFLAPRAACRSLGSTTVPPQTAEANFDEIAPSLKEPWLSTFEKRGGVKSYKNLIRISNGHLIWYLLILNLDIVNMRNYQGA